MILLPGKVSLEPTALLQAYSRGIFPMQVDLELRWVTGDPRAVFPLDQPLHIPRRLATSLRRTREAGRFQTTTDQAFAQVIRACAQRPHEGTWISEPIREAYENLYRLGHAHSMEVWEKDELVGGLYGVALGAVFFGESIFNHKPDAGKVALVQLVHHLQRQGYRLLDIQMVTDLTIQFQPQEIPLRDYLRRLSTLLNEPVAFSGEASGSGAMVPD
jgi:leucyl/phenylalanyl-tRNA--protein transferase